MSSVSKTKLFATLFSVLAVADAQGWVKLTPECLETLKAVLGTGIAWGMRDAIEKVRG